MEDEPAEQQEFWNAVKMELGRRRMDQKDVEKIFASLEKVIPQPGRPRMSFMEEPDGQEEGQEPDDWEERALHGED
jgi:hypothetical protein